MKKAVPAIFVDIANAFNDASVQKPDSRNEVKMRFSTPVFQAGSGHPLLPARFHGRAVKGGRRRDGRNRDQGPVPSLRVGCAAVVTRLDQDASPLARDLDGPDVSGQVLRQAGAPCGKDGVLLPVVLQAGYLLYEESRKEPAADFPFPVLQGRARVFA